MRLTSRQPDRFTRKEDTMILLGIVLLIIGFIVTLPFIWTLGVIVVVIGLVLAITGHAGHQLAGRSHWY
jgi:uncharacterized membrane protein HdeD (DUF308 family)